LFESILTKTQTHTQLTDSAIRATKEDGNYTLIPKAFPILSDVTYLINYIFLNCTLQIKVSVCLSGVLSKRLKRSTWHSAYPILRYSGIRLTPKLKILLS